MNEIFNADNYAKFFLLFWIFTVLIIALTSPSKKGLKWWLFVPAFILAIIFGVHYLSIIVALLLIGIEKLMGLMNHNDFLEPIEMHFLWCFSISIVSFICAQKFEKSLHENSNEIE